MQLHLGVSITLSHSECSWHLEILFTGHIEELGKGGETMLWFGWRVECVGMLSMS